MTKILLVEDDSFLLTLYQDILKQEGFAVSTSSDGKDALNQIKRNAWDLVLLDVILPHMTGFEIVRSLQKEHFHLSCPLIFLTNLDSSSQLQDAKKLADGYLIKSNLNPNQFISEVKKYLRKK